MAAIELRIPRIAEPTSSVGTSLSPVLSAAIRQISAWAKFSAVALLIRNSTVTSLSDSDREARWIIHRVGDGCLTDAMILVRYSEPDRVYILECMPASHARRVRVKRHPELTKATLKTDPEETAYIGLAHSRPRARCFRHGAADAAAARGSLESVERWSVHSGRGGPVLDVEVAHLGLVVEVVVRHLRVVGRRRDHYEPEGGSSGR